MSQILQQGYVVTPGPFDGAQLSALVRGYDAFVENASAADGKRGSTSLRVGGLANAGPLFDVIYMHPPLLDAARSVIGAPLRLSAYHARTLAPKVAAEPLHQDFPPLRDGWPMVGFILMVDAFSPVNGATRFLAGSQARAGLSVQPEPDHPDLRHALGPAGSMIFYNGSVWHGHGSNQTDIPRRSIQGALIRRDQKPAVDHRAMTWPATRARLSAEAMELLDL